MNARWQDLGRKYIVAQIQRQSQAGCGNEVRMFEKLFAALDVSAPSTVSNSKAVGLARCGNPSGNTLAWGGLTAS